MLFMRRTMVFTLVLAGCFTTAGPLVDADPEKPAPAKADKPGLPTAKGDPTKGTPAVTPTDAGSELLAAVLRPAKRPGRLDAPRLPAPPFSASVPPGLHAFLPNSSPPLPRLGSPRRSPPRPRMVVPEVLDEGFGEPMPPSRARFLTLGKEKEDSVDVRQPPPLPPLAMRPTDRVPLDDPTREASGLAVLVGAIPERTSAVPYAPSSVPEPYEFRRPLPLPRPEERSVPQVAAPETPEKPRP